MDFQDSTYPVCTTEWQGEVDTMRVMLMTDLEGVAGVRCADGWLTPGDRFYTVGCRLLTEEINAVVDGLFAGGATYVQVADGHGYGAIDIELLDPRVDYARGWPGGFPFGLDASYQGIAWVGQHAKASTPFSHIAHTQSFKYIDLKLNGVSIGEFGQLAMCAAELGVPAFFAAGEQALTEEAEALVPGIVTCPVKRGVTPGTGETCTTEEYGRRNSGAVHMHPRRARAALRLAAEAAVQKLRRNPPSLIPLRGPFELEVLMRPDVPDQPRMRGRNTHPASVIAVMNMPFELQPV